MMKKAGLVLTGGGARAAYQAGVLLGISEFMPKGLFPFPIIAGISAGSLNAAFLACFKGSFQDSTKRLWDIWKNLESEDVFHQTKTGFAWIAFRALLNIYFGHLFKPKWPDALLDSEPLNNLVRRHIDVDAVQARINSGELHGVSFSATNFSTGMTVTFFEAHPSIKPWIRADYVGQKTRLNHKHVMASSAIPGIFKLVEIDKEFFGDGSTRVAFPVSPAIHLGAERILAIDMRCRERQAKPQVVADGQYPNIGKIFSSLLDSIFSDSLDRDLERLEIVNQFVSAAPDANPQWRRIPKLLIRPSKSLDDMVKDTYHSLSLPLRRILKILGQDDYSNNDLMSHLAFESVYTERLLQLGRDDALNREAELKEFLA